MIQKIQQPAVIAALSRLPLLSVAGLFIVGPLLRWLSLYLPIAGGISSLIGMIATIRIIYWLFRHSSGWLRIFKLAWKGTPAGLIDSSIRLMDGWPTLVETQGWVSRDAFGQKPTLVARLFTRLTGGTTELGPQIIGITEGKRGPVAEIATTVRVTGSIIASQEERIADIWNVPAVRITRSGPQRTLIQALVTDPLAERGSFSIRDFGGRYPGKMPLDPLPLGITEEGELATGSLHHTLIIGGTGSGKGSALWSIIWALAPARAAGFAKFVACDPKNAEFRGREKVLGPISVQNDDIARTVKEVREEMERRILASTSRSFTPSTELPALVLFFDEFTSAPVTFDPKEWKVVESDLRAILSKGRSLGVYLVVAGQEATKERLSLRDLFPIRIALGLANKTETEMVLGPSAIEDGAAPHAIEQATPANGYKTAGIAYTLQEGSGFVAMRFPYASDDDLDYLCDAMPQ